MSIKCEACGNSNVRVSHQKDPMDAAEAKNRKIPYRCRECRTRFYAESAGQSLVKKRRRTPRHSWQAILKQHRRAVINSSIFLLLFGLFFFCLLYLVNYHPGAESSLTHAVEGLRAA